MPCPYCGAALDDGVRLCRACGRLIAPRRPGQPPTPVPTTPPPVPSVQPPTPGPDPSHQPGSSYGGDPYGPFLDLASLPPETVATWRQHRFQATFSVLVLILIHLLTFGLASPFLIARKYAFLPAVRRDDFSTARAAGFLFIPFFGMYWVFVLCRRIVDRLTLQSRLWSLPGAPSKGMATALAIGWVLGAIPYVNLLFWFPLQLVLWPIYLVQVQRFCNRLAIEVAPPEVRPSMLALERATRLRWIGWIVIAPCLVLVTTSAVVAVVVTPERMTELAVGIAFFLGVAVSGGVLLYLGKRRTREIEQGLESRAPTILASYLRIDKNAAWSVVWIAGMLSLTFVLAGFSTVNAPEPTTPPSDGWPSVALGTILGAGAAYAATRALQLKQEIARLIEPPRSDVNSGRAGR